MAEVNDRVNEDFEALSKPAPADLGVDQNGLVAIPPKVTEGLADLTKTKIARDESVFSETERRLEEGRQRALKAYEATGIQPGEFQPWDADQQAEKYKTDPIQAFGSVGSVFAMLASAFTKDPMTNSLMAGAAAMDAIKEGDQLNFQRAYDAWKQNNDLAFKRHQLQQQSYDSALRLMDSDLRAGEAKMKMEAARFGDQKALFLLENGYNAELVDYLNKSAQAAQAMIKASEAATESTFKKKAFESVSRQIDAQAAQVKQQNQEAIGSASYSGDTSEATGAGVVQLTPEQEVVGHKLAAFQRIYNLPANPKLAVIADYMNKNPMATSDDILKVWQKIDATGSSSMSTPAQIQRRAQEYEQDPNHEAYGNPKLAYDIAAKEITAAQQAGKRDTPQSINAAEIKRRTDENIAAGMTPEKAFEKAQADVARARAVPSGNRLDDMASQITRFKVSEQTIDKVEALLKKHNALAGLGGKITRPAEVVANIFGSNETDRAQYKSYIEELRELGPRLIQESKGRPLAAEESRIAAIVPGLDMGDTTINTAKRLVELQKLFRVLRSDLEKRRAGTWTPENAAETPGAPARAAPTGKKPWESIPIDTPAPGKRSAGSPRAVVARRRVLRAAGQRGPCAATGRCDDTPGRGVECR